MIFNKIDILSITLKIYYTISKYKDNEEHKMLIKNLN